MTDIEYLMGAVVIRCPECDHGIDPHGTDPGGICGVGDEHGTACECLMSPNGIASHLFHKTLDLGLWLIAEERHKGELAAAYWRDDVLPAVRQADSGFLQLARQSMASLRRVHSPVRGDSWRSKPDEWYCGHCLNGDGSPAEWPCKSAEHLYTPDEWNMPPMPRGCPHEGECGGGYAHREYTTVAQTRACQPEWVCGTKHVGGES